DATPSKNERITHEIAACLPVETAPMRTGLFHRHDTWRNLAALTRIHTARNASRHRYRNRYALVSAREYAPGCFSRPNFRPFASQMVGTLGNSQPFHLDFSCRGHGTGVISFHDDRRGFFDREQSFYHAQLPGANPVPE